MSARLTVRHGDLAAGTATFCDDQGMVMEFRNRDPEYLDWIAAHPNWFVMNKTFAGDQPGSLWLHHAYCTSIIGAPANGASWTTTSTKYGARTLAELKRFAASEWHGLPEKCTKCL